MTTLLIQILLTCQYFMLLHLRHRNRV